MQKNHRISEEEDYHFNEEVELQEQKTLTKRTKLKVNDISI
jgi:hypothetical protein